jgi:acyl-CoA thioester hydrolase
MPLTHLRTFRVRHYECDAYGHVNHANYLRYMQEAAFDASAAAGYDMDRYKEMGQSWLIRETKIDYLRPLRYGDSVEIKTWVADFRRVRSWRAYEFRRVGSGELVARAETDWAFLETRSGRPVAIPAEMKAAFIPETTTPPTLPRERFPPAPPPPPGAFQQRRRAEWRDVDQAGHVNNAVYVTYIEDCGLQMAAAYGWSLARMEEAGFAIVARHHHIGYREPALLDDELELTTWISEVGRSTAVRHSTVARVTDSARLARVRTAHVWVDPRTGKPMPIPERCLQDLAPVVAEETGDRP